MAASPPLARSRVRRPPLWLRLSMPSWLVSLIFHATLLIVLALTVQVRPRGLPGGFGREGLSLFESGGNGDGSGEYFDDEPAGALVLAQRFPCRPWPKRTEEPAQTPLPPALFR